MFDPLELGDEAAITLKRKVWTFVFEGVSQTRSRLSVSSCLHWDGSSTERMFKAMSINAMFDPLELDTETAVTLKREVWVFLFYDMRSRLITKQETHSPRKGIQLFGQVPLELEADECDTNAWVARLPMTPPAPHVFWAGGPDSGSASMGGRVKEPLPSLILDSTAGTSMCSCISFSIGGRGEGAPALDTRIFLHGYGPQPSAIAFHGTFIGFHLRYDLL